MYCLLIIIYVTLQLLAPGIFTDDVSAFLAKFHQSEYIIKLERAEVCHYDKNIVNNFELRPFRYNRSSIIALNITFGYKIDLGYEKQAVIQMYKFLSNEYRHFPLRFQVPFCDAIRTNMLGIGKYPCGNFTGCPLKKGITYRICNWTPDEKMGPPLIPTGRYMAELQFLFRGQDIVMAKMYAEIKVCDPRGLEGWVQRETFECQVVSDWKALNKKRFLTLVQSQYNEPVMNSRQA